MRSTSDYQALLAPWLASKPKFLAKIGAKTQAFAALQAAVSNAAATLYDLDQAVGVFLDVLGIWIGLNRNVSTPLANVYFSWDTPGLGWDQANWQGPYDPSQGLVRLDDTTYRTMLRIKIATNHWNGTVGAIASALDNVLIAYPGSLLFVENKFDMTMVVGIAGTIPPALILALLGGGYFPFQPQGVEVIFRVTSVNNTPIFGFDVENSYVSGWDTGSWGVTPQT